MVEVLGELTLHGIADTIAAATLLRPEAVHRALVPEGRLVESGIVFVEPRPGRLTDKVGVHARLLDLVLLPGVDRERFVSRFLPVAAPPSLEASDYVCLEEEVCLARNLLEGALRDRRAGINLLFHGPTGTGKTELARLLAREINATLHVVGREDERGESAPCDERLRSLLLGNRLLGRDRALLLFDEMEDLFEPAWAWAPAFGSRAKGRVSKQWFNLALETNAVPTVWIANRVAGVDPAFLRRFAYVIETRPPGFAQRRRLWKRHLDGFPAIGAADLDALAERFETSPGHIATAAVGARLLSAAQPVRRETIEALLAPGHRLVSGRDRPAGTPAQGFDLAAVHTPVDLEEVAARFAGWRPGGGPGVSLCLHGPPGTGKTEFVRYLARRMGRRVVERRVSDVTSCWVGQTEKNIASAFDEAERDEAVLLFDEADSFLRDRRGARHGWEVTEVNEFLSQLERFAGVVACTTNQLSDLDQASLRRFAFKIPFLYLDEERAVRLFRSVFAPVLAGPVGEDDDLLLRREFARIANLAAGDFAAVARRVLLLGHKLGARDLLAELRLEVDVKEDVSHRVGFLG